MKGASSTVYGLVFGIYELVILLTSPLFGKLILVIEPSRLVIGGLFLAGVSTVLFGLLDQLPAGSAFISMAFAVRIFEGVGAAAFMTASYTIMAAEFPERVATTFALLETCFGLGLILGPTVGGALYGWGGYWLPFVALGAFLLLGGGVTTACLTKRTEEQAPATTGTGNIFKFMADFSILVDAFAIASSLNFIGFNAATLEPHLRQFELAPIVVGAVFILTGTVYAVTSPIFGKLCDAGFDEKALMLTGSVLCVVGCLFIGPLPLFAFDAQLWLIIVSLIVIGLGMSAKLVTGFVDAINYSIKVRGLPDDMTTYGMVSAMFFST